MPGERIAGMSDTDGRRALQRSHTPEEIEHRLRSGPSHSYLRDFIYGAIDGAVTTFAVVSGVAGAGLSPGIVLILGMANLFGDGFSMAASNFLATRAEAQQAHRARREEEREIELFPEGEREEIRQIFRGKGFEGEDLDRAVEIITSDVTRWVDTMLQEEHGITSGGPCAFKAGAITFVAFVVIGALPLISFVVDYFTPGAMGPAFLVSTLLTGVAFFIVGACKSRFVDQRWWLAGLETMGVGAGAAVIAYAVGLALKGVAA